MPPTAAPTETLATATATDAAAAEAVTLRDDERQRCEVWTRVMGYHRPVASFNTGKKGEFAERTYFREGRCQPPLR
ncbi:MAG: anaerobic ribonucleoside-triphosphate reductase [Rhodoferax sp.]